MIVTEHPYERDANLIRHSSDNGMKIKQVETGIVYSDAVDTFPCKYTYEETDEPIEGALNDVPVGVEQSDTDSAKNTEGE